MPYSDVMYFEGWMVGGGGGYNKVLAICQLNLRPFISCQLVGCK